MRLLHRPLRAGGAAVLGLATIALTGAFTAGAQASTSAQAAVSPTLVALQNSLPRTTDAQTGAFTAPQMSVEVGLAPRDAAGLNAELKAVYTPGNRDYGKFLAKGQFDARYAPTAATTNAVAAYLRDAGLTVSSTNSPFLLEATGSSAKITAAFHTSLRNYVDRKGKRYFSNSSSVRVPASIASAVVGVGLTNTVRLQSSAVRPSSSKAAKKSSSSAASCETGYVTTAELFDLVSNNVGFNYGYGGAPGCGGLTPSQTNSMYGAPSANPRTEGAGVTALRLPGVGHQHLGPALLREALHRPARERHRRRRPARPGLPGRRHLPCQFQRVLG
jgi:subtilase family serine protease